MKFDYDVVIVGAGAAGVGIAHVLKTLGIKRFTILERHDVGASFFRWPREMRFISPSFTGNAFGLLDLNAVTVDTSPAYTLESEHPSGRQFAEYLRLIVRTYKLPVKTGMDVLSVRAGDDGSEKLASGETAGFVIETRDRAIRARFVIWAAGEFQYPQRNGFDGSDLCVHNATITSWRAAAEGSLGLPLEEVRSDKSIDEKAGKHFIVIGGSESGIDAAINLSRHDRTVTVLDSGMPWESTGSDPSKSLAPYTVERLDRALKNNRIELIGKTQVKSVMRKGGLYLVRAKGKTWTSGNPPILATGFAGSLRLIEPLFEWLDNGYVKLTGNDESTRVPGLFVTGPMVQHENAVFCFIYKFRQRFAVVANVVAQRLGVDTEPLELYRTKQMFLDDLSCCEEECAC